MVGGMDTITADQFRAVPGRRGLAPASDRGVRAVPHPRLRHRREAVRRHRRARRGRRTITRMSTSRYGTVRVTTPHPLRRRAHDEGRRPRAADLRGRARTRHRGPDRPHAGTHARRHHPRPGGDPSVLEGGHGVRRGRRGRPVRRRRPRPAHLVPTGAAVTAREVPPRRERPPRRASRRAWRPRSRRAASIADDSHAPNWWTLSDADGHKVDLSPWRGPRE